MNPKEVKKWQCNGIVAIAINPYYASIMQANNETPNEYLDRRKKYQEFEDWRFDVSNQPLTSLVGEFDAEDVEVVDKWEFRTWDEENEGWFDWVSSTQKYCETLTGTHQTRQSYELIPKVKEVKEENKMKQSCTKPNCNCAEKEMIKQGTELIKNYPCLNADTNFGELKTPKVKEVLQDERKSKQEDLEMNDYEKSVLSKVSEFMEDYPKYSFDDDLNRVVTWVVVEQTEPLIKALKMFTGDYEVGYKTMTKYMYKAAIEALKEVEK